MATHKIPHGATSPNSKEEEREFQAPAALNRLAAISQSEAVVGARHHNSKSNLRFDGACVGTDSGIAYESEPANLKDSTLEKH